MKEILTISKDGVTELLQRLLDSFQVIGPVSAKGQVLFKRVSSPEELDLEYRGHTVLPPKRFFFPEKEVLFIYEKTDDEIRLYDWLKVVEEGRRILVGVRPCDIVGFKCLDKVFMGEYNDPYYEARRRTTVIIGLTCNEPEDYCFCTYTGSGPYIKDGYDLLFTDLGDKYLVEVGSDKGLRLVKLNLDLFTKAEKSEIEEREKLLAAVESKIREQGLPDLTRINDKLKEVFQADLWREYGRRCLSCGKCNFVCPTCRCFDVYDVSSFDGKIGKRVRVWDSCHFLSFTRVASGEVFRKERPSRLKQRIYHKYCYSIDEIGSISCVGCGRCIEVCPVSIDIREAVSRALNLAQEVAVR